MIACWFTNKLAWSILQGQRVEVEGAIQANFNEIANQLAEVTEGMSGREIEKMCSNIYVSLLLNCGQLGAFTYFDSLILTNRLVWAVA